MVHWNGMVGLVRLRMLRLAISKYWTRDLASSNSLCEARRAMPTSAMGVFSPFLRHTSREVGYRGVVEALVYRKDTAGLRLEEVDKPRVGINDVLIQVL